MRLSEATRSSAAADPAEHLRRRVIEETAAAVRATSVRATIIHVTLATAYARSLQEWLSTRY